MATSSLPLIFLQAGISAVLACAVAWSLLRLARRAFPGLDARRTPWLLAQLAGAAVLVLVMLPGSARWSLFASAPEALVAGFAAPLAAGSLGGALPYGAAEPAAGDALAALAWLWLAIYVAGAGAHALRWARMRRALRALLLAAEPLDGPALRAHPALGARRRGLPPVLEIDAPVSPMLAGLFQPVLLLPTHMRALPPAQQRLIVAHELMHLRRRDHLWQHAGALLQALLWFVPFAHGFQQRLQWAMELGCDRAVLAGRPDSERRDYAAALLAQLAVLAKGLATAHTARSALPFGVGGAQDVAARIRLIREARPAPRFSAASLLSLLLLPGLCGASVLLQPQFAWRESGDEAPVAGDAPAGWQAPLAQLRVTGEYGEINRPGGRPHRGMDFGAARGTAVLTPAAGRVSISTDRYEGGARYGKVVVIEHAEGTRTLYAHLDQRLVRAGDSVRAGQPIALSGATGKVTGPHLHFEVSRKGAPIDPQLVLGGALAQRR